MVALLLLLVCSGFSCFSTFLLTVFFVCGSCVVPRSCCCFFLAGLLFWRFILVLKGSVACFCFARLSLLVWLLA